MKLLLSLFITFAKVGVMTFGGGYAMLPILQREVVENKGWATEEELADWFAIGQCTPGVIAVNAATFIGSKIKGFFGALFATLGVITPSIIIITVIAAFISNFAHLPVVIHAFAGIRVAVAALILSTCIKLFKSAIKCPEQLGIAIASFAAVTFLGASPIVIVIVCGVFGLFFIDLSKLDKKREDKKND